MIEKIKTKEEAKKLIDYAIELYLQSMVSDYDLRKIVEEVKHQLTGKKES